MLECLGQGLWLLLYSVWPQDTVGVMAAALIPSSQPLIMAKAWHRCHRLCVYVCKVHVCAAEIWCRMAA